MQNLVLILATFVDFSIIEGKIPFLMSLLQMKNLGVSLNLRRKPAIIIFQQGFLKGPGVLFIVIEKDA